MALTPQSGGWKPNPTKALYYGSGSVSKYLLDSLPSSTSKAFLLTTNSLKDSPSIKSVQSILGSRLIGTFSSIGAHAPVKDLDAALSEIQKDPSVDTIISIGGGSPIDSAKAISYRLHEKSDKWLWHITIPTTLSAAECTMIAGYTGEDGVKIAHVNPQLVPQVVIYDADFVAGQTPPKLWLSTGIRAVDHAIESWYRTDYPAGPARAMVYAGAKDLFEYLPQAKNNPDDKEIITRLQLAVFNSLWPFGTGLSGGLGLSHSLGYALGSPYGIPHGITSCMTLAKVVRLRAEQPENAKLLSQLTNIVGKGQPTGDDKADAIKVGDAIEELVQTLGLSTNLTEHKVDQKEIDIIVERATGGDKGELAQKVKSLVQTLW